MNGETSQGTELAELLALLAYRRGSFRLASGKQSDFYVDVKQAVLTTRGVALVGDSLCERLVAHGVGSVGGMAVGAIPLVTAALAQAASRGHVLEGFFVRKEAKEHGTARRIDGRFDPRARIGLLEDVVTTGESTLAAVEAVEAAGGTVDLIVTVVDRQEEGGMARLAARVAAVEALTTRAAIVAAADRTTTA